MEGDVTPQAVTPEGGAPVTPAAAAPVQAESYINPDGTLKAGWESKYIPQEFQNRPCYKAIKPDISSIMAHIGNQDIAISKQGKGVFVPGPEANQAEKDFFYKAIGRPDKAEDYAFDVPKEMAEWYDAKPEDIGAFKAAMHRVGATPQVFEAAKGVFFEMLNREQQNMIKDPLPYLEEVMAYAQPVLQEKAVADLKAKWGDAYDVRLLEAQKVFNRFLPEGEQRDRLNMLIGNNPEIADIFATIGVELLSEGKGPDTSTGSPAVSNMSVQQRIEQISQELTPQLRLTNRVRYDSLLEERSKLYNMRYPENAKP